ncbi:MAG: 3-hydroxyacyl-CoA dehydrogenase NAD-binding domain-containing protein [Zetaproteobacteria bacterium]|nr:3-hydroxyacyl-CoA dehydrogenase NAD-binding domain-containing protein [Zetaproteobacteria bacterium]
MPSNLATKIQPIPLDLKYMRVEEIDKVCVVTLDNPDEKVNTLNSKLIPEFEQVLSNLNEDKHLEALVIISGKSDNFVAGADISELQAATTQEEIADLSRKGQEIFRKIENLAVPVVAAIHGSCLGGGMELALAAKYRIASSSSKTVLGLPEVMLGLLPGSGGTQRLPKLIGLEQSLKMMLTGASVKAQKAKKIGLIDHIVTPEGILEKSVQAAKELAARTLIVQRKKPKGAIMGLLDKTKAGKKFILQKAAEGVQKQTRGLYPAPKEIIHVLAYSLDAKTEADAYQKESQSFAMLSQTPESKGLISLYFAQTAAKKNPYGNAQHTAKHLAVLGAGLMGAGISYVSLTKDFDVRLKDISDERIAAGKKYIWDILAKRVKRGSLNKFDASATMGKLFGQVGYECFNHVDVVIEAVFEDLDLKHRVLKEVESNMREDAIFASNTSALPISEIAKASARPENVIGLHYFSPVEKMPLLEIIRTDKTSDSTVQTCFDIGIRQGKTVIVVKDGPGFYTTRILAPFMDEAAHVVLEGMSFRHLDNIMKDFGFPVGPISLIDEVGVDVAIHVAESLGESFGKRVSSANASLLKEIAAEGSLGRKSGKGFFIYNQPKLNWLQKTLAGKSSAKPLNPVALKAAEKYKSPKNSLNDVVDIQKRLCYRMINEACYCLQEGILSSPRDGDIGAVFGLGFPPFTGGPFRYIDQVGVKSIVADLQRFQQDFGERFNPAQILLDHATTEKPFYS